MGRQNEGELEEAKTFYENGNPTLETLTAVLTALGLELTVQKRAA
jgi:DNA-binding phage protein